MRQNKRAFTLAEVLIVLGIIGVVAAMTIPTLMHNIQEKQFTVAAKKALSDVNNAYKMMQVTDVEFNVIVCTTSEDCPGCCFDSNFGKNFKLLANHFKSPKTCFSKNANKCWSCSDGEAGLYSSKPPKYLGCSISSYAFVDTSGRAWYMYSNSEGIFLVDTNGFAGPNKLGKDRWEFYLPDPRPFQARTSKGMIVPAWDYNRTTEEPRWCPSGDCKYGTVFYNK